MIVYRHKPQVSGPVTPEWLDGWTPVAGHSVCHRDTGKGHIVGVAEPILFSPPLRWFDVDQDWEGAFRGPLNHGVLARAQLWCDVRPALDLAERCWMAPVILTEEGGRAFRCSYGPSWLPELTPAQDRAEKIAKAARDALDGGGVDMAVACQWAAELLCITYHLHVNVISNLALLDDRLVPEVLSAASGRSLEVARGNS